MRGGEGSYIMKAGIFRPGMKNIFCLKTISKTSFKKWLSGGIEKLIKATVS